MKQTHFARTTQPPKSPTLRGRVLAAVGLALLLPVLCAAPVHGAAARPDKTDKLEKGDWAGVKAMLAEQANLVEKEIAQRIMKRSDTASDQSPRLEMEIDLRIFTRWYLLQAQTAASGSELQVTCRLRAQLLTEAAVALDETLARQAVKLTAAQAAAMTSLHQLSFGLADLKSIKEADDVSRRIGGLLLAIGGGNDKTVVVPRPKRIRIEVPANNSTATRQVTPAQMADEIRQLNVSVALRQQLLGMATAAGADENDSDTTYRMLADAMELARALGANTAVSPDAATQMERQLSESAALFMDPRTRAAGTARVASLQQYRQTVTRIAHMNLSAEQATQLAPVFAWIRENGDDGARALSALERFHQCRARFAARGKQPNPLQQLRRSSEELEKQFNLAATAFTSATLELTKIVDPIRLAGDLDAKAEEIRRIADTLDRLDQIPVAIETLNTLKPRPTGALERRATAAAVALTTPASAGRPEALRALEQIIQLAKTVNDISANLKTAEIPQPLEKRWTGSRLASLDSRWRELAAELASGLAAGEALDNRKLARLNLTLELFQALKQAVAMDMALASSVAVLPRWVDWHLPIEDLKPMLLPYPQAMSEAYAAYAANSTGWEERWQTTAKRYRPLVAEILRVAPYREQCALFPTGLTGAAASLMTPMDNAPYSADRYVGFAAALWKWQALQRSTLGTATSADAPDALTALGKKLGE